MNKLLSFLFFVFPFCMNAQDTPDNSGQNTLQSKLRVGITISITTTNYRFSNTDYTNQQVFFYQNRLQESYTVFADMSFGKRIELDGELSYKDLGWDRKDTVQTIEHPSGLQTQYRYNYIGFSINAGYKFWYGKIWSAYGTAGCGIAILANASSKTIDNDKVYLNQAPLLSPQKELVNLSLGLKNVFQLSTHWGIGVSASAIQYLSKIEPVVIVKTRTMGVASLSTYFTF